MTTIEVPDFRYSGFYFADILQDLLVWMRSNVPEISDEDPHEPFIQLLRAYALVGHSSNVLLDHVARETYLPTARLRESVKMHLALLGYRLKQATPSVADLILKLSSPLTVPKNIPAAIQFSTRSAVNSPSIYFETGDAETLPASNILSRAWELDASGPTWTDRTAALNTIGAPFTPWGGFPHAADCLYLGHSRIEWDRVHLTLPTAGDCWDDDDHAWEYRDNHADASAPDSVADLGGGSLRFDLSSFLGTYDRHGLTVRVRCNLTGASEDLTVTWSGAVNRIDTVTYLGQTSPSLLVGDYTLTAEWCEVPDVSETTTTTTRTVDFTLPETLTREWTQGEVNGVTAFWLRLRIVRNATITPAFDRAQIDLRKQYLKVMVTQGESQLDNPAGSSTGQASQQFITTQEDVIEGTLTVQVNEGAGWVAWTEVVDFLSSNTTSRHYVLSYDVDGRGVVMFGDGETGKIPPAGAGNVKFIYRYDAATNGNMGAGAIVQNASGLSIVATVTNPRPAVGWQCAEGADEADLARVKVAGPAAALRTAGRAVTAEDCELMVVRGFVAVDGSSPAVRAKAIEEEYGPKTVGLAVVGAGGTAIPVAYMAEIDKYFNGDPVTETAGVLVLNHELTSHNFVPRIINIVATVTGGDLALVEAALRAYLSPVAVKGDGSWRHAFGGTVARAKLIDVIFDADEDVTDVVLTTPGANVVLADDELPVVGTITL